MKWKLFALDELLDGSSALWHFGDCLPEFKPDTDETRINDLIELIRLRLVRITFGRWHLNEEKVIQIDEAILAVSNPSSWQPTDGEPGYIIELTEAGFEALRQHGIGGKAKT